MVWILPGQLGWTGPLPGAAGGVGVKQRQALETRAVPHCVGALVGSATLGVARYPAQKAGEVLLTYFSTAL